MTRSSTKIYLESSHIDRILLQEDLLSVVNWADANNMELNEEKFQLLQHGKLPDLKQPYILPSGETLKGSDHVKDLGVYIDPDLNWRTHIAMKSAQARNMASWVLRTFISRDVATMMLLYKSYVRSHLEYCCPLWSPHMQCEIIKLEAVQRSFTAKIQGLGNLNYWERLRRLSMYSLQRRRERYTIILVWKIYNNLAPNSMNINFRETSRYGTTCIRPLGSSKLHALTRHEVLPPVFEDFTEILSWKTPSVSGDHLTSTNACCRLFSSNDKKMNERIKAVNNEIKSNVSWFHRQSETARSRIFTFANDLVGNQNSYSINTGFTLKDRGEKMLYVSLREGLN